MKILADMSITILHHGHIRLLKKAAELGTVIVGLSSDADIKKYKGSKPILTFEQRKEILQSIKFVTDVVNVPFIITDDILDKHNIDYLIHGDEPNLNTVDKERVISIPRTKGISSSKICSQYQI